MTTKLTAAIIFTVSLVTLLTREKVIAFHTADADVQRICDKAFIVISCIFVFDGF